MMSRNISLAAAMVAAAGMGALAVQPAVAQYGGLPSQYQERNSQNDFRDRNPPPQFQGRGASNRFEDGYRTGYRAGYEAARNRTQYDDTDYTYGYGRDSNNYSDDTGQRWRQRYTRTYTYNDDAFYQQCRQSVDPAGAIAGALIGGLLGNAVGRGNGGATAAGVIIGGVTGAAMTRNLNCEDRSYAYKTYYDGFNSGRPNSVYQWRNPSNGHYGNFRVVSYANDPDGFRCANYSQEIFVNGRPQTTAGRACRQPDGTWAIVS
jgi:surface antigen